MATTKKPFGASGTCPSLKKTLARGFLLLVLITSSALYGFWPRCLSTHKERSWTQEVMGNFNLNLDMSRIPSVWVTCLVSGDKIAVFTSWACPGECMKKISAVKEVSVAHLCLVTQPVSTSPSDAPTGSAYSWLLLMVGLTSLHLPGSVQSEWLCIKWNEQFSGAFPAVCEWFIPFLCFRHPSISTWGISSINWSPYGS